MARALKSRLESLKKIPRLMEYNNGSQPYKTTTPTNTTITHNNKTAQTDIQKANAKQILQINHNTLFQP